MSDGDGDGARADPAGTPRGRHRRVVTLFEAALATPEADRDAWLARATDGDPPLLAEVRAMLAADARPDAVLDGGLRPLAALVPPRRDAALAPAARVGPYRIVRELARGGMAVVHLAHDERHDRDVALKVLPGDAADDGDVARFLREIRLAARLQHPHLCPVYDSGEVDGRPWYAMPLVEGAPLARGMRHDPAVVARLVREAAAALQVAHDAGIVHRDVKPENLLRTRDGTTLVADFGIARRTAGDATTGAVRTGRALGTPAYMSPEQWTDDAIGPGADQFALAAVAWELLAGRHPSSSAEEPGRRGPIVPERVQPIGAVRDDLPAGLDDVLARALAVDPRARYPRITDFGDAVARIVATPAGAPPARRTAGREAAARDTAPRGDAGPARRRAPVRVGATIAVLGALAFGASRALRPGEGAPATIVPDGGTAVPLSRIDAANDAFLAGEAEGGGLAAIDRVSLERSERRYLDAVRLDSTFGAAWARLAVTRGFLLSRRHGATVDPRTALAVALDQALRLAPDDPSTTFAASLSARFNNVGLPGATAIAREGVVRHPRDPLLLGQVAILDLAAGHLDAALATLQRADTALAPSANIAWRLAHVLLWARRPVEAWRAAMRGRAIAPTNLIVVDMAVRAAVAEGDLARVRRLVAELEGSPSFREGQVLSYVAQTFDLAFALSPAQLRTLLTVPDSVFDSDMRAAWMKVQAAELLGDEALAGRRRVAALARFDTLRGPEWALIRAGERAGPAAARDSAAARLERVGEGNMARDAQFGPQARYAAAIAWARAGRPERAVAVLARVLAAPGPYTPAWLAADPRLSSLRGLPRFDALVAVGTAPATR